MDERGDAAVPSSGTTPRPRDAGAVMAVDASPGTLDRDAAADFECGGQPCAGRKIGDANIAPCCVRDDEGRETSVCGLVAEDFPSGHPAAGLNGCVPNAGLPVHRSEYCGQVLDLLQPDGGANGGLDLTQAGAPAVAGGCCLANGTCGAILEPAEDADAGTRSGVGCVGVWRLEPLLSLPEARALLGSPYLPYCDPASAEALADGSTTTVVGLPAYLCGCGRDAVDDGRGPVPCLGHTPASVCGADAPTSADLATVPSGVCGCGVGAPDAGTDPSACLRGVATSVCGTK